MPTGIYDHSKNPGFAGHKHSELTKERMRESQRIAQRNRRIREKGQKYVNDMVGWGNQL